MTELSTQSTLQYGSEFSSINIYRKKEERGKKKKRKKSSKKTIILKILIKKLFRIKSHGENEIRINSWATNVIFPS